METYFTAQQFAAALGLSRQAVVKVLRDRPSIEKETFKGQKANAWRVSALPIKLQVQLSKTARERFYRSPEHLLSEPAKVWMPEVLISQIDPRDRATATERRTILAPILNAHHERPIAELARMAAALPESPLCTERTFRNWISNAIERDRGQLDWGRWEIYLDEGIKPAVHTAPEPAAPVVSAPVKPQKARPEAVQIPWTDTDIISAACQHIEELTTGGASFKDAVAAVLDTQAAHGISIAANRDSARKKLKIAFDRWQQLGRDGLADQRAVKSGRKPLVVLTEAEEKSIKGLYVQTESKTTALRLFASSPGCRPELADAILKPRTSKHTLTRSLREQIEVPDQVIGYHKSPKDVRVNAFINPRRLTYIDAQGVEKKLQPGDLFERDDMSNNFLCWVPWPWGGDPCSDKYGVRIARGQNLLKIDVRSLFFTSFNFLIRLRDSYRADDIWQWVGQTYRDIGLPRIGERWERGTWASKRLRGDKAALIESGHTDDLARLGGMHALGLKVIESHSPTTKIIENRFRFLQRACNTIPGQIGAHRGEMERENNIWTACRLGHKDPRNYFLSFEQSCNAIEEKLHWVNSQPVEGTVYHGVPAKMWADGIGANPLQKLAPGKGYLFSRDKHEYTARKGHVLVRRTNPDGTRTGWYFHHPELYRYEGEKITVHLDGYAPSEGATLVCAQGADRGNVIGLAELVEGCPQFSLGSQDNDSLLGATERKREFMDAVQSEYRALGVDGRRLARAVNIDNGAGAVVRIEQRNGGDHVPTVQPIRVPTAAPAPPAREPAANPLIPRGGMLALIFEADEPKADSVKEGADLMSIARARKGQSGDSEPAAKNRLGNPELSEAARAGGGLTL